MADYSAARSVHETLTSTTLDTVNLTQTWDWVEIVNVDGAASLYVSFTDNTIESGDPDTEIVPAGESVLLKPAALPNPTTNHHQIHVVGNANTYAVCGHRGLAVRPVSGQLVVDGSGDSTFPVDALDTTGSTPGHVLTDVAGEAAWAAPSVESADIDHIVKLTQAAYDALTPDAATLYVIVG